MRNRKITDDECRAFNMTAEKHRNETLSYSMLSQLLNEAGIKNPRHFIEKMLNYTIPIIIKDGRGQYRFSEKPVHIKALQYAWDYKQPDKKEAEESLEDQIEDAILLLSDNGYKVLKRIFDQEEALANPNRPVSDFIQWKEVL